MHTHTYLHTVLKKCAEQHPTEQRHQIILHQRIAVLHTAGPLTHLLTYPNLFSKDNSILSICFQYQHSLYPIKAEFLKFLNYLIPPKHSMQLVLADCGSSMLTPFLQVEKFNNISSSTTQINPCIAQWYIFISPYI